jgi:gamma-glutamylputrescine oxidase
VIASQPIWWGALPEQGAPFPGGTVQADFAIIGGGFAGLSAALHLLERRPGACVVVLEAERIGAGASGRTTGMLGPGVGQNLVGLIGRVGAERAQALYRATLRAVDDVCRLVREQAIDCELALSGQVVVGRTPAGRARLARQAQWMDQLELPVERLDTRALEQTIKLAPAARGRSVDDGRPAALKLAHAGTLHPGKLLAGLAERVRARGGVIYEGARVSAIGGNRPARLSIAGGGEVVASEVVVATAGYTSELGLLRGRVLPIQLQVLVTEPLTAEQRAAIGWAGREGVLDARRLFNYFRLDAQDRIVFGGGPPRYGRVDVAGERALQQLALELASTFELGDRPLEVAGGWTGVIGYVLDGLPAIARARGRACVTHVVGWCGHGVALSIASGAWVTRMLCDGAAPEDLPWYRDDPPGVPLAPVRKVAFDVAIGAMQLLDRWS